MNKTLFCFISLFFILGIFFVEAKDSDKDGISDESDRFPYDFDNDGMPDDWEIRYGLQFDINDANLDPDSDGLSNLEEFRYNIDPLSRDSDSDGLNDYEYVNNSSDGLVWPLVVIPILIIIGVLALYIFEKYHHKKVVVYSTQKNKDLLFPKPSQSNIRRIF